MLPSTDAEEADVKRHLVSADLARFARYCVVGASSFMVGCLIFNAFYWITGRVALSTTLSFAISVVNGFIWNRKWTFRDKRGRPAWEQASKFLAVNVVGYMLNLTIMGLVIAAWTTAGPIFGAAAKHAALGIISGETRHRYPLLIVNGAGVVATAVVIAWNYLANKTWSFRH